MLCYVMWYHVRERSGISCKSIFHYRIRRSLDSTQLLLLPTSSVLSHLIISYLIMTYSVLSDLSLSGYIVSSYLILSHLIWSYLILSCLIAFCLLILSHLILPCLVLSGDILFCLIWSVFVWLHCLTLSCLILSVISIYLHVCSSLSVAAPDSIYILQFIWHFAMLFLLLLTSDISSVVV